MATGVISHSEFNKLATCFQAMSTSLGDNWLLEIVQESIGENDPVIMLIKKDVKSLILTKPNEDIATEDSGEEIMVAALDLDIEEDIFCVTPKVDKSEVEHTPCSMEYHVVYSPSYSVPVLYFNISKPDGQLVKLEELWNCIPQQYQDRLQHERWTFLTQQEHPLLQRPYYQLHPCHTSDLMSNFGISSNVKSNYLVTWLSTVGPIVHLDIPISYATILQSIAT